jgi:NTE family protein
MSKIITRQIQLIEKLYDFFEKSDKTALADSAEQEKIKKEYNNLVSNHGAEIHSVTRITRNRLGTPNISKNADFSIRTIKDLISQGERKTLRSIKKFKESKPHNYGPKL